LKTGFGPRQSTGLAAVSPPYARANGIRFSGSRALQHHLSVVRLPGDERTLGEVAKSVQQYEYRNGNRHQREDSARHRGAAFEIFGERQCDQRTSCPADNQRAE
jgi:hypothetical protein